MISGNVKTCKMWPIIKLAIWTFLMGSVHRIPLVTGETTYIVAFLGQTGKEHARNGTGRGHGLNTPGTVNGPALNISGSATYTVVMTNSDNTTISVNITGKGGLVEALNIPAYKHKSIEFNDSHSLQGSQHKNKSWTIASNGSFTLQTYAVNHDTGHTEGFLCIPIETLTGPRVIHGYYEYIIASFCGTSGYCQFALAALEDKTFVSVTLPPSVDNVVLCIHGKHFHTKNNTRINLNKHFAVQVETTQDLSGTRMYSRKAFVAFVGARNLTFNGKTGHVVEQLLPASNWGRNYFVRSLGRGENGDVIKIAANWANTTVNIEGYPEFKIAHFSHVISRRLRTNETIIIKSSKPIQIVQISGLVGNSSSGTFCPGLVVVPAIQQRSLNVVGFCGTNTKFQLYMEKDSELAVTPDSIENVTINTHRYSMATVTSNSTGRYSLFSTNNSTLGGVMKCGDSAFLPINLHRVESKHTVHPSNGTSAAAGADFQQCTDGFEAQTTPHGRAHEVDIRMYRRVKVRVQACGEVRFKFYERSPSANVSVPPYEAVFEVGPRRFAVVYCNETCTRIQSRENYRKNNNYHRHIDCTVDMASYWFSVDNGSRLCGGPGPFYHHHETCVELVRPFVPHRLTLIGANADAYFNYDLENVNCQHRMSVWRCEDRVSNCSDYSVTYCNGTTYPDFVDVLCSKYCGKCTPDSSGRDFRVALPQSRNSSQINDCKIYVLSSVPNTKVSVGIPHNALPANQLTDHYTRYDCTPRTTRLKDTDVIVIISNHDVVVTVLMSTVHGIPVVFTVYPVDTFGMVYMPFIEGSTLCHCNVVSLTGTPVVIEHDSRNGTNGTDKQLLYITPHESTPTYSNISGTCNIGRVITATRPIGVFCGGVLSDKGGNQGYYQVHPSVTLGTHYLTPKLSFHDLTKHVNATLVIQSVTNATRFEVKNMSDSQVIVNQTIGGQRYRLLIDPQTFYNITSDGPIAVGIYVEDVSRNHDQFVPLPSTSAFITNAVVSIPLSYLKSDLYNVSDVTSYMVTDTANFNITAVQRKANDTLYQLRHPGIPHFSITVFTGRNRWFLYPLPGKLTEIGIKEGEPTPCVTSFPVIGDGIDNDCDGLIDEDTCALGYGVTGTDTDQDGACNEDCSTVTYPGRHVKPPRVPRCFRVPNSRLYQCWVPCKCPCSWKTNLDKFNRLTDEEKDQFAAESNEKYKQLLQVKKEFLSKTRNTKLSIPDHRVSAKGIGLGGIGLVTAFLAVIVILDMKSIVNAVWTLFDNITSVCRSNTPRSRRLSGSHRVVPLRGIQS